ncbi:uncharacterized protein LOC123563081 [Mercenaria mercenaria]|uniref:uncharacterized protein LOC123563081 n=1 Tax=Mercenaria mercenaria TaxID=6596 RepID=UPI00234F5A50|nr:uncharacterized protein LOC123563081 [Mercenaria mercenaria]
MESGYDFAKKIFVQENFQPPREVEDAKPMYWKIPGALKTGAKLDVFMTLLSEFQGPSLCLTSLQEEEEGAILNRGHYFNLNFLVKRIQVYEGVDGSSKGDKYIENWSVKAGSKLEVKMSWLAQKDSVAVYANDVELLTYRLNVSLDAMKQICIYEVNRPDTRLTATVDRIQFTA